MWAQVHTWSTSTLQCVTWRLGATLVQMWTPGETYGTCLKDSRAYNIYKNISFFQCTQIEARKKKVLSTKIHGAVQWQFNQSYQGTCWQLNATTGVESIKAQARHSYISKKQTKKNKYTTKHEYKHALYLCRTCNPRGMYTCLYTAQLLLSGGPFIRGIKKEGLGTSQYKPFPQNTLLADL